MVLYIDNKTYKERSYKHYIKTQVQEKTRTLSNKIRAGQKCTS